MKSVRVILEQRGDELVASLPAEAARSVGLTPGSSVKVTPASAETSAEMMERWLKEMKGKEPPPLVWEDDPPRGSEI